MNKFSVYQFLSFVMPGFIASYFAYFIAAKVFDCKLSLVIDNTIINTLILITFFIIVGIAIHILTLMLIKIKAIGKIIMPSVQKISSKGKLNKLIPFLNEEYFKIKKHKEPNVQGEVAASNLFDFAYYYLEVNNQITPSKDYQSLYYLFRNMFTLTLLILPISLISFIVILIGNQCVIKQAELCLLTSIIAAIALFATCFIARWLRMKYINKVLWSYYIIRVHKEN